MTGVHNQPYGERVTRTKKPKKWLEEDEYNRILKVAKEKEYWRWLMVVMFRFFRVGEVVGRIEYDMPGIYKRDLREKGVWIVRKGYAGIPGLKMLPDWLMKLLRDYSASMGSDDKLFPIMERQAENVMRDFAMEAGLEDWKLVSPHRIRAFTATNARDKGMPGPQIQQVMGHSKYSTTENYYIGPMAEHQVKELRDRAVENPLDSSDSHSSDNGQSSRDEGSGTPDNTA